MTNDTLIIREARYMTRKEIVLKAINKQITWIQAADILGITPRHMRRLKTRYEKGGYGGLRDYRVGKAHRRRIQPDGRQRADRQRHRHRLRPVGGGRIDHRDRRGVGPGREARDVHDR